LGDATYEPLDRHILQHFLGKWWNRYTAMTRSSEPHWLRQVALWAGEGVSVGNVTECTPLRYYKKLWTNNSLQGNYWNTDNIDDKIIKTEELKQAIKKTGISPAEGNLDCELCKYAGD
jgi:hypothetical protein